MTQKESVDAASLHPIVHTPGPRHVHGGRGYMVKAGEASIAECRQQLKHSEIAANAKLIVTAPEMFRIIQRLATADWIGETELNLWRKECREIISKVV